MMRLRRGVLPLMIYLAFSVAIARAGEPEMTPKGREQGKTFGPYLQKSIVAAEQNDRTTAQMQLREGLRASAYSLQLRDDLLSTAWKLFRGARLGCGGPALQPLPSWVLVAQAAIGDVAGAEETARNQPSASKSLAAFWIISEVQAGDTRTLDTVDSEPWIKKEWIYDEDRFYRNENNSVPAKIDTTPLKRLISTAPDREGAHQTLRKALPYARAIRSDALPLFLLSCRQLWLGDLIGSLTSTAYLLGNPSFYVALAILGSILMLGIRSYRRRMVRRVRNATT